MNRIILFLSLLILPINLWASDHCTDPDKYTVDKRCYVTDKQKAEKPYNAVVALVKGNFIYCTGTIVKAANGKLYMYTAKHCTGDENDLVQSKLTIMLQNGRTLEVTKNKVGVYNIEYDVVTVGDWAIYQLDVSDVPSVERTNKILYGVGPLTANYDARLVGYGSLKIMSDKEIEDFKQKYITWLKEEKDINVSSWNKRFYGFYGDGISLTSTYGAAFEKQLESEYWLDLFANDELKVSNCKYSSNGKQINCQGWGGSSGGPIFDDKNAIMGIYTRGIDVIGGENHAGSEDVWFELIPCSIPLLK